MEKLYSRLLERVMENTAFFVLLSESINKNSKDFSNIRGKAVSFDFSNLIQKNPCSNEIIYTYACLLAQARRQTKRRKAR
ncbi:MAG: hypothetical protein K0R47_4750 [Brevibacillus sp.]|nr:hypothetical protein [Brevibacillus sp.]